ncbi:hypothetical protein ACJ5NV_01360 [Loktanella agnita]|uniref:hypothetical protein n=1 Tax=Loktanella agnita TaxID=287097 RepID=UPI00398655C5
MSDAKIEFQEFDLDWNTLKGLPKNHLVVFSVVSFAVSEVNALRKLFLAQNHPYTKIPSIDSAGNIARFVLLRTWSAKLFEFLEFLKSIEKRKNDAIISELSRDSQHQVNNLAKGEGYEVARCLRHETANHYSFDAAIKNYPHISEDGDFNLYTHNFGGNDFFPIGEELMFNARLNRKWRNIPEKQERDRLFNDWLGWCLEMTDALVLIHARFAHGLIFVPLGRNDMKETCYQLPDYLVGDLYDVIVPIFTERAGA